MYPPVSLTKRTVHHVQEGGKLPISCGHINERSKPPAIWTHWLKDSTHNKCDSLVPFPSCVASQSLISPFLLSFSFFSLKSNKTTKKKKKKEKEVADDLQLRDSNRQSRQVHFGRLDLSIENGWGGNRTIRISSCPVRYIWAQKFCSDLVSIG